jgi:tRNA (mo5U34)-methyltransferase
MYIDRKKEPTGESAEDLCDLDAILGRTIELPRKHADFVPPVFADEWPPERLSSITPRSSADEVRRAIEWVDELVGWFHSVDLPQGLSTPGGRGWEIRAETFDIASLVAGASVLDLGSMEGGDLFCAQDAGAASVTSCDVDNYFGYDLGRNSAWDYTVERYLEAKRRGPEWEWAFFNSKRLGFELCRRARGSNAQRISSSIYDLDPGVHGIFDVTYCFGLLYHLRHPLLAIDKLRAVTGRVALVNNQITPEADANHVAFYPETWRGAHTNWFVPTPEAFLGMLSSAGFSRLEVVGMHDNSMSVMCTV